MIVNDIAVTSGGGFEACMKTDNRLVSQNVFRNRSGQMQFCVGTKYPSVHMTFCMRIKMYDLTGKACTPASVRPAQNKFL